MKEMPEATIAIKITMLMASKAYVAGDGSDAALVPAGNAVEPGTSWRGSAGSWERHVLQIGEVSPKVKDGNSAPHWRQLANLKVPRLSPNIVFAGVLQSAANLVRILVWNLLYSPAASRNALIPVNLRDESFS